MRKVSKNKNHILLKNYYDKILVPFFDVLIDLKKGIGGRIFKFDIATIVRLNVLPANFPLSIFTARNGTISMEEKITKLLSTTTLIALQRERYIFTEQNEQLFKGIAPKQYRRNDNLYAIFSKIFYELLFDDKECWLFVDNSVFDRGVHYSNFVEENLPVCPLCDISSIITKSNSICEHFLPRSKFPYVSMNPYNIIVACNACNFAEEGKGERMFMPITTPYLLEVGNEVTFSLAKKNGSVIDVLMPNKLELTNYEKLLQLKRRYGTPEVTAYAILKQKVDKRNVEAYLKNNTPSEALDIMLDGLDIDPFFYYRRYYLTDLIKNPE